MNQPKTKTENGIT